MHAPDRQTRASDAPAWSDAAHALYRAAQAVADDTGPGSTATLVQQLAQILGAATVFVAVFTDESRQRMRTLVAVLDGKLLRNIDYEVQGTPCVQVVGRGYRCVARGVAVELPPGSILAAKGMDCCAAYPLNDRDGQPLGLLAAMDRRPIADAALAEALLKIFAARIAAGIERGRADEALQRSEASYRAIFDAAEDAIMIHAGDSGAIVDVNLKACQAYGYSRDEMCGLSLGDISSGVEPYTAERAREHIAQARLGRCAPFEWHCRNRDGSLRWDEVRLKPVMIDGRHHIVAFTRDITERKAAVDALRAREEQYRVVFDGSADALVLWNGDIRCVDVNSAFTRLFGYTRTESIGGTFPRRFGDEAIRQRVACIRAALNGQERLLETRAVRKDGSHFDIEVRYLPIRYGGAPHVLSIGRDITERKAALAALQSQEQKYRAIFDGSVDSMVLWSEDLHVVDVNRAFVQMTGMSREQVIGKHWSVRPDAGDMRRLVPYIERALRGEEVQAIETVERDDGSLFEIELRYLPVRLGGTHYALGVGRDVSERLERERALQRSETQYRDIFNASTDSLVLRDANFRIVDVNATYETMTGYTRDEVLGAERVFANPAEIAPTIRALHQRALDGEPVVLETRLVHRDGARYHLELRGVPVQHRGAPHVLYIGRDITEGKRAEQALRDSEEQYRAIFNASADGVVLRDAEFRAVDVNPAYLAMSGYAREEVLSSPQVLTQPDPLVRQRHREQHLQILAGKPVRFETSGLRKDGSPYHVEVNGMPVAYRGRPHVLYAARDITERRLAEERRAELENQLRQAQKMEAIGQLTGGIAHDFNNILTSVIGYLVLGQERADKLGDAALQRQLGQAQLAAQRARELIAQMLAFARRQRGERHVLALAPLVDQALQLLRATLPSSVALDYPVATLGGEAQVQADPVQLEQVLFNLCINARDAITGPGLIRVRLGARRGGWHCASCRARVDAGRWVELSVADNGSGIAPELLERVFEPFTSTKEVGRGSGMGLAMVHGIVHDHGGHVAVETTPGAGSVFSVLLPPALGATAVEPAASAPTAPAGPVCARVMVVDDEAMVGEFMGELLSGWGIEVVVQREPMQALAWLEDRGKPLDLLITDQTMPQLQGLQLAERVVALRPGLPVLLYTGNADGIDEAEAKRHGVCGVLRKPVDTDALRALIQRCLSSH